MRAKSIGQLVAAVLVFGWTTSAHATRPIRPAADAPVVEPCGSESDIQPQSAVRERYQGADAAAFLLGVGAIDEASPLPKNLSAVLLSGSEVFGGNAVFVATGTCLRGSPLFLDPVRYRLGRATVARRRAGLPIALAPLSALAARGDAEAQLLAGSRREAAVPGSGRALLESAARQGQALAMLELGYLVAGLGEPLDVAEPDRAVGQCWLKSAVAAGDGEIAGLGTTWLAELAARLTAAERDSARALWDRSAAAAPAEMCR